MNSKRKFSNQEAEEERELNDSDREFGSQDKNIKGDDLDQYEDKDYNKIEQLDDYEREGLDDNQYSDMDLSQKRKADEEIERSY